MPLSGILLFAAIQVIPAGASMPPRSSRIFTASGGTEPYTFVLAGNSSGGTLTPNGGYKAGAKGNVQDLIRVTDDKGEMQTVTVIVGPSVTVSPAAVKVPPFGAYKFMATGGAGSGYVWTVDGSGRIDDDGRYIASAGGSATIEATDPLGNSATATIATGPGLAVAPVNVEVDPGGSIFFSPSGGSGLYTFSFSVLRSGGTIDAQRGIYTAGAHGGVDDLLMLADSVGATANATIHVRTNDVQPDGGTPVGPAPATTSTVLDTPESTENGITPHSVNLAGGGGADNACDCGTVGAPNRSSSSLVLALTAGLVFFARRRRVD